MARGGPEPGGVQGGFELGHGAADEAGVLDPGVADLGQGLEGAGQVDGQLVAQGVQLDADLVGRDPVPALALGAGFVGEGGGGQGPGGAEGRGGGGGGAQEPPAAGPTQLLTTGGVVSVCAHATSRSTQGQLEEPSPSEPNAQNRAKLDQSAQPATRAWLTAHSRA